MGMRKTYIGPTSLHTREQCAAIPTATERQVIAYQAGKPPARGQVAIPRPVVNDGFYFLHLLTLLKQLPCTIEQLETKKDEDRTAHYLENPEMYGGFE